MGACQFIETADAEYYKTADRAFDALVESKLWECGHGGYTGTIGEKTEFVWRNGGKPVPARELGTFTDKDGMDNKKWGPAYAVPFCESEDDLTVIGWAFYGWAPS